MRRFSSFLLLTACAPEGPRTRMLDVDPSCAFDAASMPTVGERGQIGFGYFPAASQALDVPIAAGGAHTNLLAFSSIAVTEVDHVTSSAPAVASFKIAAAADSTCQHQYLVTVHSGQPGSADLILVAADGSEVDRVGVVVAPTEELLFDRGWDGPDAPTVLAGSLQGLHVTTLGKDGVLVGTGAVRFSLSGALAEFPDDSAEPPWWGGDEITFTGGPGDGVVSAEADHARLEVAIHVIDETALTQLDLRTASGDGPLSRDVFVTAFAGETPVYGAECDWRWPVRKRPLWMDGGWIGAPAPAHYRFTVETPGTYQAVCVLPGGTERNIELVFADTGPEFRM
jgi:hypothetical protein